MSQASRPLPGWLPWTATILSLAGLAVSLYLTIAHYTSPKLLACPSVSILNCGKVTTSSYAEIMGLPVALLGLVYFMAMLPLQLPTAWRRRRQLLEWGRFGWSAAGVVTVIWFIYVELFKLNAICPYCTAVHVITGLLFILTALGTAFLEEQT